MPSTASTVVLHDVSFTWPDGSQALTSISGTFGAGRTGLIGDNGVGKSTLLELVAGELAPSAGSLTVSGSVAYMPQALALDARATIADVLAITPIMNALHALEAGEASAEVFEAIGNDWDIESRALAELAAVGLGFAQLGASALSRPIATLSGGEAMLVALVGVRLGGASIAILDEPTNNLDERGRERVYELVRSWRGALIVVSHDVRLLELMDDTAELRDGELRTVGGPYSEFVRQLEVEQEAAQRRLRAAEHTFKVEKRRRIEAEERIAHSERQGRKDIANKKFVKAVVNERRNSAEKSQNGRRGIHTAKVDAARLAVDAADRAVRDDDAIAIVLPDPDVPASRRLAVLTGSDGREHVIQGPDRIALTGANGVGKSTLVRSLVRPLGEAGEGAGNARAGGEDARRARAVALTERVGYLSQQLDALRDSETVLDAVRTHAPTVPVPELRNRLARLHVRGTMLDRLVATLSGGERFRVALAQVLYADPPAQLLVLDEPTNNLDIRSVAQLVAALASYRGASIVISHDGAFLAQLDLTTELELSSNGRLLARQH